MKNTFKKAIVAPLALALAAGMSISAFAAAETVGTGSKDIAVSAKYEDSTTPAGTTYSVDVTWDSMEFTYTVSGSKVWEPTKHDYTVSTTDVWSSDNNKITVTNHSNAGIKASFAYAPIAGYTTVTGEFSNASLNLPSAVGKAMDAAELTGKTALNLKGTLPSDTTAMTRVGTVTVTIEAE